MNAAVSICVVGIAIALFLLAFIADMRAATAEKRIFAIECALDMHKSSQEAKCAKLVGDNNDL